MRFGERLREGPPEGFWCQELENTRRRRPGPPAQYPSPRIMSKRSLEERGGVQGWLMCSRRGHENETDLVDVGMRRDEGHVHLNATVSVNKNLVDCRSGGAAVQTSTRDADRRVPRLVGFSNDEPPPRHPLLQRCPQQHSKDVKYCLSGKWCASYPPAIKFL
jgi:hypothetical protein